MKLNGNYQSVKFVLNRLLKDEPYITEINLADAAEWTGEFLNSLGILEFYKQYTCEVDIVECRGVLPTNFKDIEAIRNKVSKINLKESISKFPSQGSETELELYENFQIKENIIFTEFETGTLEILYNGYILDKDGFPLIPDEERVLKGVYWYIAHKMAYKKWTMSKLSDKIYQYVEQQMLFYLGSARYAGKMPSKQKMESIKDQQLRLVPDTVAYKNAFVSLNNIEQLKLK